MAPDAAPPSPERVYPGCVIEVLAAAALAAPCRPPERAHVVEQTRQVVVYREGRDTVACGRRGRVKVHPRYHAGRLLALRVAGTRVAVVTGSGPARRNLQGVGIAVFDVATRRLQRRGGVGFPARGRLHAVALDRGGAVAIGVSGSAGRGIHVVNAHGRFPLDRRVNAALGSLRAGRGRFRWRYRGVTQTQPADAPPPVPPEDCSIPRGAETMVRGSASVYVLEHDAGSVTTTTVHGCLAGAHPHRLTELRIDHSDFYAGTHTVSFAAVRPPFVALNWSSWVHKSGSAGVRAYDLRTGAVAVEGCGSSYYASGSPEPQTSVVRVLLSGSGRVACSTRTWFDGRLDRAGVVSVAAGEEPVTHDSGPDLDAESLRVEGDQLVWTRGGARRTASFP